MTVTRSGNKVDLVINDLNVSNNAFVDSFIAGVADGLVSPLSGSSSCRTMKIVVDGGVCSVMFDGEPAQSNSFVDNMITSTLAGMAGVLGINGPVERLALKVDR